MKSRQIFEFDPQVYPFRLWVGIQIPYEEIENTFWALNSDMERTPFDEAYYKRNCFVVATCFPVAHKESGWIGIYCSIWRNNDLNVGRIAHESSHITDFMFEEFGINNNGFDNGEPRAYFVEWCANCIDKVKRGKI